MKNKKKINKFLGAIILFILFFVAFYIFEMAHYQNEFSIDRLMLYISVLLFSELNIILDFKKMWNFIFIKRYYIGVIFFLILVILGYHGSSVGEYNYLIQPNSPVDNAKPFWGISRTIRSDEYSVSTPFILSQETIGTFSSYSTAVMGGSDVIMYPKLPCWNISVLTSPNQIGFLFLNAKMGYAFYWWLPIFIAFFGIFELLLIITNKNRFFSLVGTCLLTFAPAFLWWNSFGIIAYGSSAVSFFYHFFQTNKVAKKIIIAIVIGWLCGCYAMVLYPAWMIPYAYLFLGLIIAILIDNRHKIRVKDLMYILIIIGIIALLILPVIYESRDIIKLTSNTVYPGERNSVGGTNWQLLFSYLENIFFPVKILSNPCEPSQFVSLYPIPLIIGIIQIFKNIKAKKLDSYLILITLVGFFLSLWNFIDIPFITKITFLYVSTPWRSQLVVGVSCILITMRYLSVYEKKDNHKILKIIYCILAFGTVIFGIYQNEVINPGYLTIVEASFTTIFFFIMIYLLLLNTKLSKIIFGYLCIGISIFYFATITPISKGLSSVYEKPFAKKVQELVKEDKEALWISTNTTQYIANYVLANGARVLNSTNFYPKLELWKSLDENGESEDIYNRYAHVLIDINKEKTFFEYYSFDLFFLHLKTNDLCKIDIKYIASSNDLSSYSTKKVLLTNIYEEDGMYIYETNCESQV